MKARLKFTKTGSMKFIGHLDVMRYFQKALRRCDFPVAYSQGFSPHQMISFAAPLGVGLTSDGEYMDLTLTEWPGSTEEILQRLNGEMNEEIRVTGFVRIPDDAKPSMALVCAADYLVSLKEGELRDFEKSFAEFMAQKEIMVRKKTKRSEVLMDIRPFIYQFAFEPFSPMEDSVAEYQEVPAKVWLKLCTGSVTNIKPDLVMEAYYNFMDLSYPPFAWQVHRLEVYTDIAEAETEHEFIPLLQFTADSPEGAVPGEVTE
ncbi:TIGR03936 family radical SAM-associated protein [Anaerolentibacter hominis]|uniref:TIGR03936 family radical SAM-associated protein n=1 Tax=Anaerolentibacter hominis TaxID=3079009 RepID=UPI0031B7EB55